MSEPLSELDRPRACSARPVNSFGSRQRGFNIVELLVAIGIGGLLLSGAISLFVNNRATSQITQDLSRLQESGRFALETIIADLRMAGYFGCANDMSRIIESAGMSGVTAGALWDTAVPVEGINNYTSGTPTWLPTSYAVSGLSTETIEPGTDAITIRYLGARLPENVVLAASGSTVTVSGASNMEDGQVIGIADCGAVDVIQICHAGITDCGAGIGSESDPVITLSGTLSRSYDPDVSPVAAPLVGVRYFIATNDFGNPSLYRSGIAVSAAGVLQESVTELFEGVADMQLLYGIDTTQDRIADNFVTASNAALNTSTTNWSNIVAIKIGLLVQTTQARSNASSQPNLPLLLDKTLTVNTNDGLRRRIFVTTVQVRNL